MIPRAYLQIQEDCLIIIYIRYFIALIVIAYWN